MSLLGTMSKQPAEVESYTINYSDDLTEGDNVETAEVSVMPAGVTITSWAVLDPRVRIWVEGGEHGVTYKVTCTVTTADGRTLQDEFKIRVRDN